MQHYALLQLRAVQGVHAGPARSDDAPLINFVTMNISTS
jgi:hypothetical protein